MADRALRQVNPSLRALDDLLHLLDGRVEASTRHRPAPPGPRHDSVRPGRRRSRVIEAWVEDLDIRWGLDLDHRTAHGVPVASGTWEAGLQRLLLGAAVQEDGPRLIGGALPYDDIEGTVVEVAGKLAEYVDRLHLLVTHLQDPRPIAQWCADLRAAATMFCAAHGEHAWQTVQLHQLLDDFEAAPAATMPPTSTSRSPSSAPSSPTSSGAVRPGRTTAPGT